MTDPEEEVLEALDNLAFKLTGKSLTRHQARGPWIRELIEGQEFYLPDGGYSRIVVSIETGKARLTSNSRKEVKQAWSDPVCEVLIDDLETAVRLCRDEKNPLKNQ